MIGSCNPGPSATPWVLVAGGFHRLGAMDKANLVLAECLLNSGVAVHLVSHFVEPKLAEHPLATVHIVRRPASSYFLGEQRLNYVGRKVARSMLTRHSQCRVLVNGGNCRWPGAINWAHSVHHAWPCVDHAAPAWFKVKNRLAKHAARVYETAAFRRARVVLANSQKTRGDIIRMFGIPSSRVHTVYLGSGREWRPPTVSEREQARCRFPGLMERPLVAFIGALSYDNNKGFDTLWRAWSVLCKQHGWDAHLVVAGAGSGLSRWKSACAQERLDDRVHFLGFTDQIRELLFAADLLVSPVRYEAYGVNVQEAICCGVPAMVSASAGVAERYPAALRAMLLPNSEDDGDLIRRLLDWRDQRQQWKTRFQPLGAELRGHSWEHMAEQIVSIAEKVWQCGPAVRGEHVCGGSTTLT